MSGPVFFAVEIDAYKPGAAALATRSGMAGAANANPPPAPQILARQQRRQVERMARKGRQAA